MPRLLFWVRAIDTLRQADDIIGFTEEVDKQLERFLQFHIQKTAAIPGLWAVYMDAPVRPTMIVNHSKEIKVKKNTSGRIVGWELHPEDLDRGAESEVVLQHLPRRVFVAFDKVQWQLPGYSKGVLPIQPAKRTWIPIVQTDTEIARRGFILVPDFASTAFMMQ